MRKWIGLSGFVILLAACSAPPAPQTLLPTASSAVPLTTVPLTTVPPTTMPPTTVTTIAASPQATIGQMVDLSVELNALKAGDTAGAISGLEQILANSPASAEAHLLLGQAYYRADQKDKAEEQFRAAFSLNASAVPPLETQDADEWLKLGNAHASQAQFAEALAAYQTVLRIKPDKAAAYTNIGVVYYQTGKFDEAMQQMQQALELDPGDAETYYMLGATYIQQQKLDEAEKAFNKAIELKPDLAAAYTGLGNVQLARKDAAAAITTLQKATTLQPDQAEAWLALGQAYATQGSKAEANKALNQCLQTSQPGALHTRCEQLLQQLGTP